MKDSTRDQKDTNSSLLVSLRFRKDLISAIHNISQHWYELPADEAVDKAIVSSIQERLDRILTQVDLIREEIK